MIYYDYKQFCHDVQKLAEQCQQFDAEIIIAVARGGMSLGHALSMALDIRNLQSIQTESYDEEVQRDTISISGKCDLKNSQRVLIVDDIVDSGRTLAELIPHLHSEYPHIEFKTAAIFTKSTALIQPDFFLHEATDWIDFFWERDFLKPDSI